MTLITRLEEADGPSRELDGRIWCEINGKKFKEVFTESCNVLYTIPPGRKEFVSRDELPHFTSSIDAALTLAMRESDALSMLSEAIEDVMSDFAIPHDAQDWKWRVLKVYLIRAIRARSTGGEA